MAVSRMSGASCRSLTTMLCINGPTINCCEAIPVPVPVPIESVLSSVDRLRLDKSIPTLMPVRRFRRYRGSFSSAIPNRIGMGMGMVTGTGWITCKRCRNSSTALLSMSTRNRPYGKGYTVIYITGRNSRKDRAEAGMASRRENSGEHRN